MKKGQLNIKYKPRRIAFNNTEKLVGTTDRYSTIDYQSIVAYAAKAAAVPDSSVEMAMEAIFDAVNYFVLNGHSVQIPNLGTFSIGVRAKSALNEVEFTNQFSQNLRGVNIHFLPDSGLKQMISSMSINTSVEDDGYDPNGVIAVNQRYFGQNSILIPVNAGRVCMLEPLTRLVFSGTRLSSDFIGSAPLSITYIDVNGNEVPLTIGKGKTLSMGYNAISFNIGEWKKYAGRTAVALKSFTLKDTENNVISSATFATPVENTPAISTVVINGKPVDPNGTVPFETGKAVRITVYGANFNYADEIKVGTTEITPTEISDERMVLSFTPAATGSYPISVKANDTEADIYNVNFGEAGGTVISSITANGDPLYNGSNTNITAGSNYNIQIAGSGLGELTTANFTLPQGSSISITSQSDTLIQATISNAQAGTLAITIEGETVFSATLVAVVPGVQVTGYKLAQNGATQSLSTSVQASQEGVFTIFLVGQNIDDLTDDSFSGSGLEISSYDGETGELVGSGAGTLVIQDNNTTIANITIVAYSTDNDDDGLDKD